MLLPQSVPRIRVNRLSVSRRQRHAVRRTEAGRTQRAVTLPGETLYAGPPGCERVLDLRQSERPRQALIGHLFDRRGPVVKDGRWRQDDAVHLPHRLPVAQLDAVPRGLAHQQHEPAPLLATGIGRPCQEVVGVAPAIRARVFA